MRPERAGVVLRLLIAGALLVSGATAAAAQWPGEVAGRVTDAATGAPVEAALVEIPALGRAARADGAGAFRLRGLEPGSWRVVVRRAGYLSAESTAEVRNGEVARVLVALPPDPVALDPLQVQAQADRLAGTTVGREAIRAAGARTVGDVVARLPGAVVRATQPGGPQTVSVRGSSADAVLVLVDGVALNDPVTGEADLSAIPAHAVESVTLVPGARTARWGPRAQAGVVLVATRAPGVRHAAEASAGALGERAAAAEWGGAGPLAWSAGGAARTLDGSFRHERDPNDPTVVERANADLAEWSAFAAARARAAGGELRLRAGWESLERGIPGRGYAPSPRARQEMERARAHAAWRRAGAGGSLAASLSGALHRTRHHDAAPPFGLPYDTRARVRSLAFRAEGERAGGGGPLRGWGGGVEGTLQRVDAGSLSGAAPRTRTDGGAFAHAAAGTELAGADLELAAEGRLDRDGVTGEWHPTHALSLSAAAGPWRARVAHRSAFSPPTLGDQFFREGVGVAPNPDLRPERVPGEWEAGLSWSGAVAGAPVAAGATAYRSDVRGMIVWLPDFRFVWSPRNTDVLRRGAEAWADVRLPGPALRLSGSYSLARATYDRPGRRDDGVQVAYRPRHSARVDAEWAPGAWRLSLGARYVGTRYPDPSTANPLAGFWTLDAAVARGWRVGPATLDAAVRVERLRDERGALIAGYPEPGRRAVLELRLGGADRP